MPLLRTSPAWLRSLAASLCFVAAVLPLPAAPPLCRLAFEDWVATNYQAVVFHQDALSTSELELIQQLREARVRLDANLDTAVVDLSGPIDPAMQSLWAAQTNAELPWLVVRTSAGEAKPRVIWNARLKPESVGSLIDSPARRTVAAALLREETAVWVLVESGNTVQDEAAVDQLASTLKGLEKSLRGPGANPTNSPANAWLALTNVSFSLVRVTRTDPAEEFFVASLLYGLVPAPTRPVAVPVFGRGHLLPALVGKRIAAKAIQQAGRRLISPLARDPKDPLPGRNLLLAAAWNSPAPGATPTATPPAAALPGGSPAPATSLSPADATNSSVDSANSAEPAARVLRPGYLLAGTLLLAGGGVAYYCINRRRTKAAPNRRST